MKTLILNGSPRVDGDVAALIAAFRDGLDGEVLEIPGAEEVGPCTDCRRCWEASGCPIADGMRSVYPYFEQCDNLVLASPVWFSGVSGPILNLAGRLTQPYFAARRFRGEIPAIRKKRGVILLAAGNGEAAAEAAISAAKGILKPLHALPAVAIAASWNTDKLPAREDGRALESAREAAKRLNRLYSVAGA